jgi:Spy/CpxP family protein refolding chaperone
MNTRRISLFACIVVVFAILAYAQERGQGQGQGRGQGPRPKPELTAWWDQPVVRDLGLTDEQNRQIRAIVAESRDRLIQLKGAVDSAEGALRDCMDEEKVDTRRAEAAIEKVVATHADMMRAVSQMSLRMRAILTSAQWQELQKRESQPPPPLPGQPQKKKEPSDYLPAPPRFPEDREMGPVARLFAGPDR